MGSGNLVYGFRRWFQRRSARSSASSSSGTLSDDLIPALGTTLEESDLESSVNDSDDLDLTLLRLIRVPKRNLTAIDPNKKVSLGSAILVDLMLDAFDMCLLSYSLISNG